MKKLLRILHLEDNPHDRELVQTMLAAEGLVCHIEQVETKEDFRLALEAGSWDLIMSDFTLPGYDGLSALALSAEKRPEVPYLFVSGTMGEEQAVESLKHGATDYVLKHRLDRLVPAVCRALRESEERRQRQRAELLRESFFELAQQLNAATDPQAAARIILRLAQRLLGWDAGSLDLYSAQDNATRPVLMMEMVLGQMIDVPRVGTYRPITPQISQCLANAGRLIPPEEEHRSADDPASENENRLTPSYLLVPVRHGAKIIGILGIEKYVAPGYTQEDLQTLLALADHCGGALERIAIEAEKDRLMAELQKQQQRLDNILAGIPAVVWETWRSSDPPHRHTNFVSRYVETLAGYTVREWLDTPDLWLRIVHPEDKQRVYQEIERLFVTGQALAHQYRFIAKDKRVVWVETSAVIVCGNDGTPIGLRGVTIDITEKKKIEAQLLRSQRIESIGRLTSGIAHDLNNVLAPILMSAQMLRENLKDSECQSLAAIAETHAKRAADVVKQLLAFARGSECEQIPIQPKQLLEEMSQTIRETFPKSIAVSLAIQPDVSMISGNPTQLQQVLLNLCVNARDAMPNGGTLSLSAENNVLEESSVPASPDAKPGPYVVFKVRDTGSGITPEILDNIFDPFFTTKQDQGGTGLGLSTVMGIVKSHNGFVTIETEPGKGTQFSVHLPATASRKVSDAAIDEAPPAPGNSETILVVDDELAIRQLSLQVLRSTGYNVLVASNGAEALALLDRDPQTVQLVLTDLMMPVMDGVALIRAIRKMHSHVRIVAATGLGVEEKLVELRALEITSLLDKPYSPQKLLAAVRKELDRPR
ncbi:MAG: response regulator [Verrucomicrobia bacterium]|nr:response regulator [Verrucomicrobiota bacterium]